MAPIVLCFGRATIPPGKTGGSGRSEDKNLKTVSQIRTGGNQMNILLRV